MSSRTTIVSGLLSGVLPLAASGSAESPLTHIGPSSPPTITLQGESDRVVPVRQQRGLDEALRRAGVTHELYLFPASDHGFDVNWGGFATQAAREKIKAFLEKHG